MKKVLFLCLCLMCIACTKDIETDATDHLKVLMREILNKPEDASLVNPRTIYKSDSLCVIDFTLKAPNEYGTITAMEYIYVDIIRSGQRFRMESLTLPGCSIIDKFRRWEIEQREQSDIEKELSIKGFDIDYLIENDVYNVRYKYHDEIIKWAHLSPDDSKIEDKLIFSAALLKLLLRGRVVEEGKGKDIKL